MISLEEKTIHDLFKISNIIIVINTSGLKETKIKNKWSDLFQENLTAERRVRPLWTLKQDFFFSFFLNSFFFGTLAKTRLYKVMFAAFRNTHGTPPCSPPPPYPSPFLITSFNIL